MEKLDLDCLFSGFYRNKKILITGHTGFKGGWLTYWLKLMGADIVGLSLPLDAAASNHWKSLSLNGVKEYFFDIRDKEKLNALFLTEKPEIVFHFAAQALVRQSYLDPIETWSTNVLGTAQLLDSARQTPGMRAIVLATTDKCYKNKEWVWGYREIDELGGYDPYSASKAGSELVIASYRDSFFKESGCQLASIRAGNVFGGGDWSDDRLIPDLMRSLMGGHDLTIRYPNATRPWQHVLDALSGYLLVAHKIYMEIGFDSAWNFGPTISGNISVENMLNKFQLDIPDLHWNVDSKNQFHEAGMLYLDTSKAKSELGWAPIWDIDNGIKKTAEWYKAYIELNDLLTLDQIYQYVKDARQSMAVWTL